MFSITELIDKIYGIFVHLSLASNTSTSIALSAFLVLNVAGLLFYTQKNTQQIKGKMITTRPSTTFPYFKNTFDVFRHEKGMHDWIAEECMKNGGKPWIWGMWGKSDKIVMFSPQALEDVMKTHFDSFRKDPQFQDTMKDFLGNGIFIAEGANWFHQRKTTTNMFTMRAMKDFMTKSIQQKAMLLEELLISANYYKKQIDLYDYLKKFTLEAFVSIGLGVDLGTLENAAKEDKQDPFQEAFGYIQTTMARRLFMPSWIWKFKRFFNIGSEKILRENIEKIDAFVHDVISQSLKNRSGNKNNKTTIVSLFLDSMETEDDKQSKQEKVPFDPKLIRDIVLSLLLAGRDTTAQSLSWMFVNLAQNPRVEEKLREELNTQLPHLSNSREFPNMEEIQCLVYLEATIKETLRLNPVVPLNGRVASRDTVLSDGTFIKAGQHVVIPSYALGRMESIWGPDVMDFKPERWIDQDSGKLIPVSSFKFSAFNGGPRICLGKNLAMMEMKIVAAGILSRFHMEVQEPEKIRYGFGVTLHLKDPLLVHVQQVDKQQCLPVAEMC